MFVLGYMAYHLVSFFLYMYFMVGTLTGGDPTNPAKVSNLLASEFHNNLVVVTIFGAIHNPRHVKPQTHQTSDKEYRAAN